MSPLITTKYVKSITCQEFCSYNLKLQLKFFVAFRFYSEQIKLLTTVVCFYRNAFVTSKPCICIVKVRNSIFACSHEDERMMMTYKRKEKILTKICFLYYVCLVEFLRRGIIVFIRSFFVFFIVIYIVFDSLFYQSFYYNQF